MKTVVIISFGCFLFLNACAVARSATPVQVAVTAGSDVDRVFASNLRDAMLSAIAAQVPDARPLKVAVVIAEGRPGLLIRTDAMGQSQQRVIASVGPHPEQEGARPTVPVLPNDISGNVRAESAELHGSYTITDAQGRLVESKMLNITRPEFQDLMISTGDLIASRVEALSR